MSYQKVHIGSDHAGFELKRLIEAWLTEHEWDVVDHGAFDPDPLDDYPDFISKVAKAVSEDVPGAKGIVIGGSGQGEAMMANRFAGVRAAVINSSNSELVRLSREHNDSNVLSLGARFLSDEEALAILELWLTTPFSKDARHVRRIKKLDDMGPALCGCPEE